MPVIVALRPSVTDVPAIPLPASPPRRILVAPDVASSAVQRSPLRWTSAIVPVTRTSRHSVAAVGEPLSACAVGVPVPSTRTSATLRRGAPHAFPTTPVSRTRVPSWRRPSASGR